MGWHPIAQGIPPGPFEKGASTKCLRSFWDACRHSLMYDADGISFPFIQAQLCMPLMLHTGLAVPPLWLLLSAEKI